MFLRHGKFQPSVSELAGGLSVLSTRATEPAPPEHTARGDADGAATDDHQPEEEEYPSDEDAEFYDWDPSCKKGTG